MNKYGLFPLDENRFLRILNHGDVAGTAVMLRRLVDEWIDSAAKGVEKPKERILSEDTRRLLMRALDGGTRLWIRDQPGKGGQMVDWTFHPAPGTKAGLSLDDCRWCAEFVKFLESPCRYRLARCAKKGCIEPYFYRKRLLPCYEHCRCPRHAPTASRDRALEIQHAKLLADVQAAWQKLGRPEPTAKIKRQIKDIVNRRRSWGEGWIKAAWITRNWNQIAERAL